MMSRKTPVTETQVFWEVHKATVYAEEQGKKYDKAIETLIYYTNMAKRLFPQQWDRMMAEKERIEEQIKLNNQKLEEKQTEATK
jgi:ubiquinone biosynthesis protein Coq4